MLQSLSIKNYALIEDIQVSFGTGMTVITGETGAGKSILLGALGLISGRRADLKVARDPEKKCVIEGSFAVKSYNLQPLFEGLDLDYEEPTILRREILPSGKSRAFVNDTPASLQQIKQVAAQLIDIHSQHQTLDLAKEEFQMTVLDAVAGNEVLLKSYRETLNQWKAIKLEVELLRSQQEQAAKELDYHQFLYNELQELDAAKIDQSQLEEQQNRLSNSEQIMESLGNAAGLLSEADSSVLDRLRAVRASLSGIASLSPAYTSLLERVESTLIELDDVSVGLTHELEGLETDPRLLEQVESTLNRLYRLQQKHQVDDVDGLLQIQQQLYAKVEQATGADGQLEALVTRQDEVAKTCDGLALEIRKARRSIIPELQEELGQLVTQLGMPDAQFQFLLEETGEFRTNGRDRLQFLFSANPGSPLGLVSEQASGGELSRVMLAVKSILSTHQQLPTLILDEIDTGVSGALAAKMAAIMSGMSESLQLLVVTHLPQVAAAGKEHFKVYKETSDGLTNTHIRTLNDEGRIGEIALMIGGSTVSESALAHAKQLLN